MSETLKGDLWLDQYQPLEPASTFEKGIPLDQFVGLFEGQIIVGSGSPRNRRYRDVLQGQSISQLTFSGIAKLFSEVPFPDEYRNSVEIILQYEEPRRAWLNGSDSNISLNKARLTAAAVLIHAISQGKDIPPFKVLGRDYNIADSKGEFTDRPGFAMPSYVPKDKLPQGWTTKGEWTDPESPAVQCHRLYEKNKHFFTANSTTILRVDQSMASAAIIERLTDLSSVPQGMRFTTALTFMCLKPDEEILDDGFKTDALINYLSSIPLGKGGERLYAVPAVIDWSRPPFRNYLSVWVNRHNVVVHRNFDTLQNEIQRTEGSWENFQNVASETAFIEDELVGASTIAVQSLIQ